MPLTRHILVVLSGGQDSITCLGMALANSDTKVSAISFNYEQRHKVELDCAADVCGRYGVNHKVVNLGDMLASLVTSALTGHGDVGLPHAYKPGLPSSFVPGRNALFLTLAHAYAQEIKADSILAGVCQTDYSGYPDCRDAFVMQLATALNTGYQAQIRILTPLMYLTKAETFAMAARASFLDVVLEDSHTCYRGDHKTWNAWGYGCDNCPACELRKRGFKEYELTIQKTGHAFDHLTVKL